MLSALKERLCRGLCEKKEMPVTHEQPESPQGKRVEELTWEGKEVQLIIYDTLDALRQDMPDLVRKSTFVDLEVLNRRAIFVEEDIGGPGVTIYDCRRAVGKDAEGREEDLEDYVDKILNIERRREWKEWYPRY